MSGRTTDEVGDISGYTRPVPDELDERYRSLLAERHRPVPPAPKVAPSALSRYQVLADLAAAVGDDLTVADVLGDEQGAA